MPIRRQLPFRQFRAYHGIVMALMVRYNCRLGSAIQLATLAAYHLALTKNYGYVDDPSLLHQPTSRACPSPPSCGTRSVGFDGVRAPELLPTPERILRAIDHD